MTHIKTEINGNAGKSRKTNKRQLLIDAAIKLSDIRGIHGWTLADCASVSGVPLGNIYYYFKTKDELIDIVRNAYNEALNAGLTFNDSKCATKHELREARLLIELALRDIIEVENNKEIKWSHHSSDQPNIQQLPRGHKL
jgi:AcrR family transcriptional regulator